MIKLLIHVNTCWQVKQNIFIGCASDIFWFNNQNWLEKANYQLETTLGKRPIKKPGKESSQYVCLFASFMQEGVRLFSLRVWALESLVACFNVLNCSLFSFYVLLCTFLLLFIYLFGFGFVVVSGSYKANIVHIDWLMK